MIRKRLARIKKKVMKGIFWSMDKTLGTNRYTAYKLYSIGYHNPNYRFQKNEIAFMHIPKTAGTSFCRLLEKDPQNRFVLLNIHRPISTFCSPQDYRYITILRDPVARVWSLYQMALRDSEGFYRKFALQGLEPFLKKTGEARNLMCKYLAENPQKEPDQKAFEKGLTNLNTFYKVFFFNSFSKEAAVFLKSHGVPFEHIPNERKSKYPAPTAAEEALIREYNQWDIKIFETYLQKKQK